MNDSSLTTNQWLKEATGALQKVGIGTARLDALVLLEDCLEKDRSWILAHPETPLNSQTVKKLAQQLERRANHEPLAYIRGFTEFYGRRFFVDRTVLEPRPESEMMIDYLKKLPLPYSPLIADIGTGSGALGLTAALEVPGANVTLVDIDPACLAVAKKNTEHHGLAARIEKGNLSESVGAANALLCNLPYVPDSYHINEAALQEPPLAIFGGEDGLDLYLELFGQLKTKQIQYVLTESLPFQHEELAKIALGAGYKQIQKDDFIQVFQK